MGYYSQPMMGPSFDDQRMQVKTPNTRIIAKVMPLSK
jgi:hypothetical protein